MDKIKCGGFYVGDGLSIDKNSDGQPVIEISQGVEGALLPSVVAADNGKILTVDSGKWKPLSSVIPAAPSVNGSYVLTCTVSASGAVYSWESTAG